MKKTILFFIFILFSLATYENSWVKNQVILSEDFLKLDSMEAQNSKKEVVKVVISYFNAWKTRNYKKVLALTTEKEHEILKGLIKKIKKNNNKLPKELAKFLNRIKRIELTEDDIEVAPGIKSAYAECKYVMSGISTSGLIKKKVVSYLLIQVDGEWKIKYSKPLGERYQKSR